MYEILKHAHSGLRWVSLILIIAAIFNAVSSKRKGEYTPKHKKLNLFAMMFMHIQVLIGLGLFFISPKGMAATDPDIKRFFMMEHLTMMVIATIILTIGRKKAEKAVAPIVKHKKIIVWYTIALILIIASIPWPFRTSLGGQWF